MKSRKQRQRQAKRATKVENAVMRRAAPPAPPALRRFDPNVPVAPVVRLQPAAIPLSVVAEPLARPAKVAPSRLARTDIAANLSARARAETLADRVAEPVAEPGPVAGLPEQAPGRNAPGAGAKDEVRAEEDEIVAFARQIAASAPDARTSEVEGLLIREQAAAPAAPPPRPANRPESPEATPPWRELPLPRHRAPALPQQGFLQRLTGWMRRTPPRPRVAEEVRAMREEIAGLRDALDVLLTRTAAD